MSATDKLIAFYKTLLLAYGWTMEPGMKVNLELTIKALEELKKLKGEE